MRAQRPERGLPAALVAVFLVACVTYAPVVTYGFAYDDSWTLRGNRALDRPLPSLLSDLMLGRGTRAHIPDATRPLMVTSMWIDRRLFGPDAAGYHLHSLLLYGVSAGCAALCLFALLRRYWAAVAGGVLFAVAPVHAEVVSAINYREDLYASIAVTGCLAHLFWPPARGPRSPEPPATSRGASARTALTAGLFALGLLAKESTAVLVLLVPALAAVRTDLGSWLRARKAELFTFGVTFGVWALWRGWLRAAGRDDVPLVAEHRGAGERMLRTARFVSRVALDGVFPMRWSPDFAPEPAASPWWLFALVPGLVALVWLARRRARALASALVVLLVSGLPMSPLISPVNERADRFAFLAVLGGAMLWGSLLDRIPRRHGRLRIVALAAAAVAPFLVARQAAAIWKNDLSLWSAAIERAPTSSRAWAGLCRARRLAGDLPGAEAAIQRAVELDPKFLRARVNVVYNALAAGDLTRARAAIDVVERLGGHAQMGMSRARRCVELPVDEAIRCSGARVRATANGDSQGDAP